MNTLLRQTLPLLSLVLLVATPAPAASAKSTGGLPPLHDFTPAGLGAHEPELQIPYPGAARARGIVNGTARVSVLVGADGKPVDFLVTAYTHPSFGDALLDELRHRQFRPAKFMGQTVPARVEIAYQFEQASAPMSAMEEAVQMSKLGAQDIALSPVPESKLDHALELTAASLPVLPRDANLGATAGQPVKVYVSFFVDQEGHVRVPQVESAASPALVPDAIRVVQKWSFKPPVLKGKPALVLTGRPVRFVTEEEVRKAQAGQ